MGGNRRAHRIAILQALFVAFLWSTSWVLIKLGLREIPALTFAGVRYFLAFLLLVPWIATRREHRAAVARLSGGEWLQLTLLGVVFYTVTQGAQFVGLERLPAVTVGLILSFSPVAVALLGVPLLGERPPRLQWIGVGLFLAGAVVYFLPVTVPPDALGLAVVLVGMLANSVGSVLGRSVNRRGDLHPVLVTVASMGIGSVPLLAAGVAAQGWPRFSAAAWAIVLTLAAVNTAFAFTLWNHTLRTLSATESSLINNTMLIQIAVLAWIFLGEPLTGRQVAGLLAAAAGVALVQLAGSHASARSRTAGANRDRGPRRRPSGAARDG